VSPGVQSKRVAKIQNSKVLEGTDDRFSSGNNDRSLKREEVRPDKFLCLTYGVQ
jgi:hypothetical protein